MSKETLEKWIRRQLTDPVITLDGQRTCVALGVVHIRGGSTEELQVIRLGSKEWDAKSLADTFNGVIDECNAGISPDESGSGYEQFQAVSFFSDVPDLVVGRLPINRKTGPIRDMSAVSSEPPDARGELKQTMRHREATIQLGLDMMSRAGAMLLAHNESLSKRNAMLERENYDAVDLVKETIFKQAADTHAHEMAELEFARKSEERARIMKVLPAAVNQVLGREIFPQSTVDSDLVEMLVGSMKPEAVSEVIGVLGKHMNQEQLALLVGRMSEVQESINKKNADKLAREKVKEEKQNGLVTRKPD